MSLRELRCTVHEVNPLKDKLYGFLTKKEIQKAIERGKIFARNTYDLKSCLREIGYDMRLGERVLVTPEEETRTLGEDQEIIVKPGQFAILSTEEYLKIPNDVLAFVDLRASYKGQGLLNIQSFHHIDPGWEGHFAFLVCNVGPREIVLKRRGKIFSIFFYRLPTRVEPYTPTGDFRIREGIPEIFLKTLAGTKMPTLRAIDERIRKLEIYLKFYWLMITIIAVFLGALIGHILS